MEFRDDPLASVIEEIAALLATGYQPKPGIELTACRDSFATKEEHADKPEGACRRERQGAGRTQLGEDVVNAIAGFVDPSGGP